jgi:hypothetical protein
MTDVNASLLENSTLFDIIPALFTNRDISHGPYCLCAAYIGKT